MQHIYTWLALSRQYGRARPGHSAKLLAMHMLYCLSQHPQRHPFYRRQGEVVAASDATAYDEDTDTLPCIGGWWCPTRPALKSDAKWFSIEIPRTEIWAFKARSSQKRVASIELMGAVVLFKIMAAERAHGDTSLTAGANTDNQGNSYAVSKHRAKKWPAADIMLELQLTC